MHLCDTCAKADKSCPVYGDVERAVGYCIEYRKSQPDHSWVDDILDKKGRENER